MFVCLIVGPLWHILLFLKVMKGFAKEKIKAKLHLMLMFTNTFQMFGGCYVKLNCKPIYVHGRHFSFMDAVKIASLLNIPMVLIFTNFGGMASPSCSNQIVLTQGIIL